MLTERSLNRRLKRRLLKTSQSYFAVCALGFEEELETEVRRGSFLQCGGVAFTGPLDLVYQGNLQFNTAHRLLLRINEFPAHTFPMLFDQVGRIPWELWIRDGGAYRVQVTSRDSKLNMKARLIETFRSAIEARLQSLGVSPRSA